MNLNLWNQLIYQYNNFVRNTIEQVMFNEKTKLK